MMMALLMMDKGSHNPALERGDAHGHVEEGGNGS